MQISQIGYEQDFYAWLVQNAILIRQGKFTEIDAENIAEELEGLAKRDRRQLMNRLATLLMHMLKWQFQPNKRSRSWELTIIEQRIRVEELLKDSSSLKHQLEERIVDAYEIAILKAERETGLPRKKFPAVCFYTIDELLDDTFYPQ
jgi:hypothetical protein